VRNPRSYDDANFSRAWMSSTSAAKQLTWKKSSFRCRFLSASSIRLRASWVKLPFALPRKMQLQSTARKLELAGNVASWIQPCSWRCSSSSARYFGGLLLLVFSLAGKLPTWPAH
jgi:hypothetical protein